MTEDRGQMTEDRGQMTEGLGLRVEDKRLRTGEGRRQKKGVRCRVSGVSGSKAVGYSGV